MLLIDVLLERTKIFFTLVIDMIRNVILNIERLYRLLFLIDNT